MKKVVLLIAMFGLATFGSYAQTYNSNSSQTLTEPKVVHVESYQKKDGTVIQEHDRTAPNKTDKDNWSTMPNTNPETGKRGTKQPK